MSRLNAAFWNSRQQRPRAGWRLLLQLLLWFGLPILLTAMVGIVLGPAINARIPASAPFTLRVIDFIMTLIGALLGTWVAVRILDHRPFVDLGFHFNHTWWLDLLFGLALGGALMALVFVVEWMLGWIEINGLFQVSPGSQPFALEILGTLIVFVVVGITEEVLSRGYQLRNLAEGLNFPPLNPLLSLISAWMISSALFGILHVFNPNASVISTLNLFLVGLFLGLGYILTGSLALPIGLHVTWNFFQGNVFGFPVSGNDFTSATFIAIEQGGPELWTGGAFGPEAGLIGVAAMLAGSLLTLVWVRWQYGELRLRTELSVYRLPKDRGTENETTVGPAAQ